MTRFDGSPFQLDSDEVLASNGILHEDLKHFFIEILAGRDLEPLPKVEEYARARK